MPQFRYRSKGTANDDWHEDSIEAEDIEDAQEKLDEIYGIKRDDKGTQLNADMIQIEIVNK